MNRRHLLGFSALALTMGPACVFGPRTPRSLQARGARPDPGADRALSRRAAFADPDGRDLSASRSSRRRAGRRPIPTSRATRRSRRSRTKDWDVSVKSLVAFPQTLAMMNDHLDWTQKIGDAMIGQQKDVADSIQRLAPRPPPPATSNDAAAEGDDADGGIATAPSSSSRPTRKPSTCRTTTRPGRTGRGLIPPIRQSTIRRRPTTARRWPPA